MAPAYTASYAAIIPITLLFGAAASTFIFAPFVTTGRARDDDKIGEFDPAEATLGQTLVWNVWGYTAKTKVVIRRTLVSMLVTGVNTYISLRLNLYGVESAGALAYSAVWVFATLCTGLGLRFVGAD